MNYIQGYEDGITAVLEVMRGVSDSAYAEAKKCGETEEGTFAETHYVIINSMRELILEQRKRMVAMRRQRLKHKTEAMH